MHADPKSVKFQSLLSVFFVLLGSACVKTSSKLLMKLTPDDDDTQNVEQQQVVTQSDARIFKSVFVFHFHSFCLPLFS